MQPKDVCDLDQPVFKRSCHYIFVRHAKYLFYMISAFSLAEDLDNVMVEVKLSVLVTRNLKSRKPPAGGIDTLQTLLADYRGTC